MYENIQEEIYNGRAVVVVSFYRASCLFYHKLYALYIMYISVL